MDQLLLGDNLFHTNILKFALEMILTVETFRRPLSLSLSLTWIYFLVATKKSRYPENALKLITDIY